MEIERSILSIAAFALHALEAVIEYLFFIPLIIVLQMHVSVSTAYPSEMLLLNVHAHPGSELLPA